MRLTIAMKWCILYALKFDFLRSLAASRLFYILHHLGLPGFRFYIYIDIVFELFIYRDANIFLSAAQGYLPTRRQPIQASKTGKLYLKLLI